MFYFNLFCVLLLKTGSSVTIGGNILGLMGIPSPSHHIWNSVILHRLAELGHNVTVLSVDLPRPNEKIPLNMHYIHLEEGYPTHDNDLKWNITSYIGLTPFESISMFYDIGWKTCIRLTRSKGMQALLNYPDDFNVDLVFHDYTLGPMLLGFLHKFGYPPMIGLSAFLNPPNTIDAMSNHYFPAYVPYHSTNYTAYMNFRQRMENTLLFIIDTVYRRMVYNPKIDAIMRPYFPKDMPSLHELEKHTTLSMVNSHPVITYVEPVPPNVIEVGGLQILDAKPLSKEFDEFINKSRKAVILVSFGTNMKSSDFKDEEIQVILNAMLQLPQYDFIWKFDVNYLKKKLPSNIMAKAFLPQNDLLANPKVKAFVTHCGALSTHEAIWRGVPMVGVPLYFDQHRNLRQSIQAGVAVELDFRTMTTDLLRNAIKSVVEDRQMAAKAKLISSQFRDRPMKPLDTAVWWSEYLLRNPNPYHLKSPAARLNIFQANSLDVLFVLWTMLALSAYLTVKLLSMTWKKFNGRKNPTSASKLKKN